MSSLSIEEKQEIISQYRIHENDCGSPEVQIAILTKRILDLTEHLKEHRKDHASQRGLRMLVGKRSSLLGYLRGKDFSRYQTLIGRLKLRK